MDQDDPNRITHFVSVLKPMESISIVVNGVEARVSFEPVNYAGRARMVVAAPMSAKITRVRIETVQPEEPA